MSLLKGIDVSEHNAWPFHPSTQTWYDQCDFVIHRCSRGTIEDLTYRQAIAKTLQDGKLAGVYHYYGMYGNNPSVENQADFFIQTVGKYIGKVALFLDWEGQDNPYCLTHSDIPKKFIERVKEKTGVTPGLYTGISGIQYDCSNLHGIAKLWYAGWPNQNQTSWDEPQFPYGSQISPWTKSEIFIWQYSTTGGTCDRDLAYCTKNQWLQFAAGNGRMSDYGLGEVEDPRDKWLEVARKHIGPDGKKWVFDNTDVKPQTGWCVATLCAIAKECGFADVIMPSDVYLADDFSYQVVEKYGGTYIDGDSLSSIQPGDIINFPPSYFPNPDIPPEYDSGHIGIVESIDSDTIHTIEGNAGDAYVRVNRSRSKRYYFVRPDWSKVASSGKFNYDSSQTESFGPLYTTSSTRADATLREVGYMDEFGEPSIRETDVKLLVINYTSLLAEFAGLFGSSSSNGSSSEFANGDEGYSSGSPDNIDALDATPRQIVKYFMDKGLNAAAGVAIIANIERESSFNLGAIGDGGTSFGLCQWHADRGDRMKATCGGGSKWKTNLTGQLDYLWTELNGGYKSVLEVLQGLPNTEEGARQGAEYFVRHFEVPADVDNEAEKRKDNASNYWSQIVVNSNSIYSTDDYFSSNTSSSLNDSAPIKNAKPVKSIPIPTDILQKQIEGIMGDMTFYNRINWVEPCRHIYNAWVSKGSPTKHNVAVLDGYYLIAMAQRFGDIGDLIQLRFKDNTRLNCILGDSKGLGNDGQGWGHTYSHRGQVGLSLVEWEAVEDMHASLDQWGLHGKKVIQVVNYGRYI